MPRTATKTTKRPHEAKQPDLSLPLELAAPVEIIAAAEGEGESKPIRFKMVAYTGGVMRPYGYGSPVVVDLAGLKIAAQSRPVRYQHDPYSGIGHTEAITVEAGKQLVATGVVSRETEAAREVVASAKKGFPWQASIGASVEQYEFVRKGEATTANGRTFEGPLYVIRASTLNEISFVDLGADDKTSAKIAAKAKEGIMPGKIPSGETVIEAQDGAEGAGTEAASPITASASADEIRAEAAAEVTRIAAVRKVCAGKHADIEAKAILEKWDVTKTELEVMRADRPQAPAVHASADTKPTASMLECAVAMTARLPSVEKSYDNVTLEAASKRFGRGIGLQELLLEAAWANGYTGRNFRDTREVLRAAFAPDIRAGNSTVDISGILSNVANKFLLAGFMISEQTWRAVCSIRSVSDFKQITSYRLTGTDIYQKVAPGGELKHGTLSEESFTNQADTYGLMLAIDRRDIINDDLGAISTVPQKLGRGAGSKLNNVFWTAFMDNSSFFATGNANYISGATTVLGIDGLTQAEQKFLDMVDADSQPVGVMPRTLLVPTALSALAAQLMKSTEMRDTTASTKFVTTNPHAGKFDVQVSRYLGNSAYTGYSATAWYLLANPQELSTIEVAFLNGMESPTIETAEADFNRLGIQMRGYHDFGVAKQDPKGGVKSKGAA